MTEIAPPNPRTFDIFEVAQGRSYPQDVVDVYLDLDAAFQAAKVEKQIAVEPDTEVVTTLEVERKALLEKVKASRLTFHLKGLSQKAVRAIEVQADSKFGTDELNKEGKPFNEKILWRNYAWLASHIAAVYNAKDERDERVWTSEDVLNLVELIPEESSNKLMKAMQDLTFRALYFEQAEVSPDFS